MSDYYDDSFYLTFHNSYSYHITNLVLKVMVSLHRPSDFILSDCSSNFCSQLWATLSHCLNVEKKDFYHFLLLNKWVKKDD